MMKQEYVDIVAEAFRRGEFKAVTGGAPIMRSYDEAYLDERTDYDFDHMYIHLMKDEREGGFIEVFSVDTSDEYMTNQYAPARLFTDFYTKAMETKLWHLRLKFDPEREFEIEGIYETFNTDYSIVAFYVEKMPGTR